MWVVPEAGPAGHTHVPSVPGAAEVRAGPAGSSPAPDVSVPSSDPRARQTQGPEKRRPLVATVLQTLSHSLSAVHSVKPESSAGTSKE